MFISGFSAMLQKYSFVYILPDNEETNLILFEKKFEQIDKHYKLSTFAWTETASIGSNLSFVFTKIARFQDNRLIKILPAIVYLSFDLI